MAHTSRLSQGSPPSPAELETEFWNIVERGEEPVEVYYGADLNTGTVGSGFPRAGESDNPYATHKWNVNNFPKLTGEHESLLNHVNEAIQGVIVPWLYIGMCFSAFCWHVEDHMFYSINYNHYGAPKQWCAHFTFHRATACSSALPFLQLAIRPATCKHHPSTQFSHPLIYRSVTHCCALDAAASGSQR